ncbi:hypothetical protein ACM7D6_00395 [Pseudomonas aeruginosa]|uniref:hypothetical protein n=1 Tax=Pseudomonas aeruginosa TaxID=287 RepID=UPI00071BF234|nr:hypothetical protein [Pseudomonas aeruginosa]MBH3725082.1 hypothetical protein [Pseudomonas aeruginosa]MBH3776549.1 hypothetical protein [Pseudomonas aeruginosa]MCF3988028.1 hypothetical protein [Pseudomonas aeruginosa]MCF3999784.1 hypothetical protein [Pseudomonas aeruginosa]MCS8336990.1 hypothetical protein [Pseudomonas aeruginosa]
MALDINISGPYQRTLPGGQTLTFARGYDFDGVWMRYWETHTADSPYRIDNLTYDEYEEYRQQHPELNMPELKPPPPATNPQGNTQGRVNGETPATGKSAEASRTTVESETPAEDDTGTKILDGLQTTLDVAGLIPGVGEIADLANAGISLARGDYAGAALSLVSAIPFAGWFGTAGKAARRGAKAVEETAAKGSKAGGKKAGKETTEKVEQKAPDDSAKSGKKEEKPGGKGKARKPLECGQKGTYGQLSDFDAAGVGMERDHIPPQAALFQRALDLIKDSDDLPLDTDELKTLSRKIERHGQAVSIPQELHREGITNSNPDNKKNADDLQGISKKEGENHRRNMRRGDKNNKCLDTLKKATDEIGKINNSQYDEFLEKLIKDTRSGKQTRNPWNGIL